MHVPFPPGLGGCAGAASAECRHCHSAPGTRLEQSCGVGAGSAECCRSASQWGPSSAVPPQHYLQCCRGVRLGRVGGFLACCPPRLPHTAAFEKSEPGRKAQRAPTARSGAAFTSSFPISFSQPSCLSVEQHGAGGLLTPLTAQGRGCLHARLCAEAEGYSCAALLPLLLHFPAASRGGDAVLAACTAGSMGAALLQRAV